MPRTLVATIVLLLLAPAARAGDCCYVLLFASQRLPNDPDHAHTFVQFVRASGGGVAESFCISWLPADGTIRTASLVAEKGRNYTLDETLAFAHKDGQRISCWGPYRVAPELFCRAAKWMTTLESGEIRYKANDAGRSNTRVCNCIHAASSVVQGPRLRVFSPGWGETATFGVLNVYRPFLRDDEREHPWLVKALGVDAYPVIFRESQERPFSGAIFGPVYRVLGGERDLTATYGHPKAGGVPHPETRSLGRK